MVMALIQLKSHRAPNAAQDTTLIRRHIGPAQLFHGATTPIPMATVCIPLAHWFIAVKLTTALLARQFQLLVLATAL